MQARLQSTLWNECLWWEEKIGEQRKNITFPNVTILHHSFHFFGIQFECICSPLLHLVSFPIRSSFDHEQKPSVAVAAAVCHSFSFIEFNLMSQCCNFLQLWFSDVISMLRLCVCCNGWKQSMPFFCHFDARKKPMKRSHCWELPLSQSYSFTWYGNQLICFSSTNIFQCSQVDLLKYLFCTFSSCIQNLSICISMSYAQ